MGDSVAAKLQELGDPSGRQDRDYWDEWFRSVCTQEHRPFEWYCGTDEVIRMLSYHLNKITYHEDESTNGRRIIHPGSGTSLVPLEILRAHPNSKHTIVEVSPVAIEEMKLVHEKQYLEQNPAQQSTCPIEYILADILTVNAPLDLDSSSFDLWIDKGFIDAVFSEKHHEKNQEQGKLLFQEACRLLTGDGNALIISLAEEHSLKLIVENWLDDSQSHDNTSNRWSSILHIWELEPISGDMLPFGFVLTKSNTHDESRNFCLVWHSHDGTESKMELARPTLLDYISEHINSARQAFLKTRQSHADHTYVLSTIEIKPYDPDVDLVVLGDILRSSKWHFDGPKGLTELKPLWQPFTGENSDMQQVVPIGFGISKLRLKCAIDADGLDHLVLALEEWQGDDTFEGIQSVDVDWDETLPIGEPTAFNKRMQKDDRTT